MSLRIALRPGFVVGLSLLCLLDGALPWLLLAAVAVHELGHLLALQWLGVPRATLTLGLGGGEIDCPPLPPRALALTALAGPLAGLIWALLLWRPCPAGALLSLGAAGLNLLPIPPLDGGVALRALAGEHAAIPALTAGGLLVAAMGLRPWLGWWPLLLTAWVLLRAGLENRLVKPPTRR